MARVYSGSRLMLDPNFILSARRAADEREAAAREKELAIRKQEADAMAKKTELDERKIKESLIKKAELDLDDAKNAFEDAKTDREKSDALNNMKRALLDIEGAGGDISKYSLPTEKEKTIVDETAEVETDGAKKSIKGQINDLTIRYNNGFKTKAEKAAFISDIDEMRKTAKGSELDELISLREKALKYITDEEKAESKEKSKQDKANLYKAKSQNPAEFFVWFNKLNDKEKEAYEKAYKDIFGGE